MRYNNRVIEKNDKEGNKCRNKWTENLENLFLSRERTRLLRSTNDANYGEEFKCLNFYSVLITIIITTTTSFVVGVDVIFYYLLLLLLVFLFILCFFIVSITIIINSSSGSRNHCCCCCCNGRNWGVERRSWPESAAGPDLCLACRTYMALCMLPVHNLSVREIRGQNKSGPEVHGRYSRSWSPDSRLARDACPKCMVWGGWGKWGRWLGTISKTGKEEWVYGEDWEWRGRCSGRCMAWGNAPNCADARPWSRADATEETRRWSAGPSPLAARLLPLAS